MIIVILLMGRSFKERIQETEEAHGLLNNHLQTNVQVIKNLQSCCTCFGTKSWIQMFWLETSHFKSFYSVQEISDLDDHIAILKYDFKKMSQAITFSPCGLVQESSGGKEATFEGCRDQACQSVSPTKY